MLRQKVFVGAICLRLVFAVAVALADQWDMRAILTVNEPIWAPVRAGTTPLPDPAKKPRSLPKTTANLPLAALLGLASLARRICDPGALKSRILSLGDTE